MSELPGWEVPLYQSLTQPQLQCGINQTFFIAMLTLGVIGLLWWLWWVPLLAIVLYVVARIGTRYDPHFFEIIMAHLQQHHRYEG